MKGDTKVIEYLNRGLRSELTAVSQYWLHFRMLNDWGYVELAKFWRKESIEEMNHADRFIDRILFLDGFPNLQELDPGPVDDLCRDGICELDGANSRDARLFRIYEGTSQIQQLVIARETLKRGG